MTGPVFPKKIIRGASVEGLAFCPQQDQSRIDSEKTGEKNPSKNIPKEFEETIKEVEKKGYRKGLKDGHLQGFDAGKSEGLEIGFKLGSTHISTKLKTTFDLLNTIAELFSERQKEMFEIAKPELIKFCLAICENLLCKTLTDPQVFANHIETILNCSKGALTKQSTVYLSPEDYLMLQSNFKRLENLGEEFKNLQFSPDPALERGNCRIENSLGLLNYDIKRLINDLEKKILEDKTGQTNA